MDTSTITQMQDYIRRHLTEELSLDDLAGAAGYSAYHFAREFKEATGQSVMEYVRAQRIIEAAEKIKQGANIFQTALEYGFDTHAGFTKAFSAVWGCTPKECAAHARRNGWKGIEAMEMENAKIIIRPICKDDVQDLWENVYSAMTPRQITEEKILPAIENEHNGSGIELVAQVDGRVVMSLPMVKPFWIPMGMLFDNNFVLTGDDGGANHLMAMLLEEMKKHCRRMGISTLISPQYTGSPSCEAFQYFGFTEMWSAGGWTYLGLTIEA